MRPEMGPGQGFGFGLRVSFHANLFKTLRRFLTSWRGADTRGAAGTSACPSPSGRGVMRGAGG